MPTTEVKTVDVAVIGFGETLELASHVVLTEIIFSRRLVLPSGGDDLLEAPPGDESPHYRV